MTSLTVTCYPPVPSSPTTSSIASSRSQASRASGDDLALFEFVDLARRQPQFGEHLGVVLTEERSGAVEPPRNGREPIRKARHAKIPHDRMRQCLERAAVEEIGLDTEMSI